MTARILSVVVYGFDFERIFCPIIRCFGIWTFIPRDDAVEPHRTAADREPLPVAPYVLLGSVQNRTADSGIEDFVEVGQELLLIADADPLVINTGKHGIGDQSCDSLTVIALEGRLETTKKCECAWAIRTR